MPISWLNKSRHISSERRLTQRCAPTQELRGAEKAMRHCPSEQIEHPLSTDSLRKESSLFRYEIHSPPLVLRLSTIRLSSCLLWACTAYTCQLLLLSQFISSVWLLWTRFQQLTPRNKADNSLVLTGACFLFLSSCTSCLSLPEHPFFFCTKDLDLPHGKKNHSYIWWDTPFWAFTHEDCN